ncbi:MAG: UDP-N-acetylmuramate dehydrogenase [Candidatus Riflebacteria bacterium]|nr:UDP-N-acetylmuramate dehydrogenase [Candidatus Riflebacteria bacterium]
MVEGTELKKRIRPGIPLREFTTFRIGGKAELFLEVHTEAELAEAVALAQAEGLPWFLLGGGSNLVVSDQGMPGLVIRNLTADSEVVDAERLSIRISSGRRLGALVELAAGHGLTGLEPMTGIPGTVGGAIYGNAGAYGRSIADLLVAATLLDPATGRIFEVAPEFFRFAYRTSRLKTDPHIILNATFRLSRGETSAIRAQMEDVLAQRHAKHPPVGIGSAGSFFKNLPPAPGETRRRPAGEVLEKAGAKQMAVGGASVFHKHANFIVNYGEASAADVRALAARLKEKVQALFGIGLEEEVLYIGS